MPATMITSQPAALKLAISVAKSTASVETSWRSTKLPPMSWMLASMALPADWPHSESMDSTPMAWPPRSFTAISAPVRVSTVMTVLLRKM